ncbi:hypothetical protein [Methyloceanibacter sp.]|uniref:hypothetical protein n=1 Tax=Methyloceanibacter sp. TaxID=1965321 RepID=UPI002D26C673|nr:hypothetical protein [Methyloceanibacter sp.]HZP08437.1 hypothetical protein [Methyloceanibacter sp.]
MRRRLAISGLIAALSLGSAPAFAFQEQPVPPPSAAEDAAPQAKAAPLQLANPSAMTNEKQATGGVHVFGHTILPKLNFGLELLYGQDEPQVQFQQGGPSFDDNQDVTVLGKVKRHF